MTFIEDFLSGRYPQLSKDLFASDLAYSVITAAGKNKLVSVRLTPILFASDIKGILENALERSLGRKVRVVMDSEIRSDDVWALDVEISDELKEYEKFLDFLRKLHEPVECSREDFRLLKLFSLYQNFESR